MLFPAEIVSISHLARFEIIRAFRGPETEDAKRLWQVLNAHQIKEEAVDMRAKQDFVVRNVMGEYLLIPTGKNITAFNGTGMLNEVSAFIWERLQQPVSREDLLHALLDRYEVEEQTAAEDLDRVLEKMRGYGMIEEDSY